MIAIISGMFSLTARCRNLGPVPGAQGVCFLAAPPRRRGLRGPTKLARFGLRRGPTVAAVLRSCLGPTSDRRSISCTYGAYSAVKPTRAIAGSKPGGVTSVNALPRSDPVSTGAMGTASDSTNSAACNTPSREAPFILASSRRKLPCTAPIYLTRVFVAMSGKPELAQRAGAGRRNGHGADIVGAVRRRYGPGCGAQQHPDAVA